MMRFQKMVSMLFITVGLFVGNTVFAESVELQQMKQMISQMDNPPQNLLDMVKMLEESEAKSGGSNDKSLSEYSCTDDIAGTYKSSNGNQILVINSNKTGTFTQYTYDQEFKDYHGYKGEVDFDWSSTKNSMTFNYTSDFKTTQKETGDVISKPIKSGTVSCQYAGSFIDVGGVNYYK